MTVAGENPENGLEYPLKLHSSDEISRRPGWAPYTAHHPPRAQLRIDFRSYRAHYQCWCAAAYCNGVAVSAGGNSRWYCRAAGSDQARSTTACHPTSPNWRMWSGPDHLSKPSRARVHTGWPPRVPVLYLPGLGGTAGSAWENGETHAGSGNRADVGVGRRHDHGRRTDGKPQPDRSIARSNLRAALLGLSTGARACAGRSSSDDRDFSSHYRCGDRVHGGRTSCR